MLSVYRIKAIATIPNYQGRHYGNKLLENAIMNSTKFHMYTLIAKTADFRMTEFIRIQFLRMVSLRKTK
ncbi:hypothetical protein PCORN_02601 [Listeria cornellensis FSL F6-0969]|uniref:N-acetyltransferase domain-containing protein n=1 Tax=Listeria cornellensis FSL F6-0969 TaxID=1265820 RepID=W7C546_9LIST|nr:hypothetical protein PCORN_02601 [Listeria cornellensis FSL F6-0969]